MHFFMISRATAKANGLRFYFTGQDCPRGMAWERRTGNSCCICPACRELIASKAQAKYVEDPGIFRDRYLRYFSRHKDKINARTRQKRRENPEREKAAARAAYERNPERYYENVRRRQADKNRRTPVWYGEFDEFVVKECVRLVKARREATGVKWHIDHMLPMKCDSVTGLHCGLNLQVIPGYLNNAKWNYRIFDEPDDWLCALI